MRMIVELLAAIMAACIALPIIIISGLFGR